MLPTFRQFPQIDKAFVSVALDVPVLTAAIRGIGSTPA